jgi:hypothetical protein
VAVDHHDHLATHDETHCARRLRQRSHWS